MPLNSQQFWQLLQKESEEIGFAEIAATPLSSLKKEQKHLQEWLKQGMHGEMNYMKRTQEVRENPQLFLENARSVIVTTVSYYQDYPEDGLQKGLIARYATGRDYHKVIKKMLQQLVVFLQKELFPYATAEDFRISLDAHPVMERAWAEKAKLGFLGKNSCLITEKAGSWVLIGCVFTTKDIPKKPEKTEPKELDFSKLSCGSCTRCLTACPTNAIIAPGKIDARRCISYLTIENKGGIPLEFRKQMGNRLFGCDICQEVCPFNIPRQKGATNPLMEKEIAGTTVLLTDILNIATDEEFVERFAGSPLMRAKRKGLLRNACVVAGNSGDTHFISLLQKVQKRETDEMLKEHASWAIAELESQETIGKTAAKF